MFDETVLKPFLIYDYQNLKEEFKKHKNLYRMGEDSDLAKPNVEKLLNLP